VNKLVRSLLSGASLATLQLCAIGGAARATTISGARGAYTNPAGVTTANILVTYSGDITGDLTNEGTVGPSYTGIEVDGSISGTLTNAKGGVIKAFGTGIFVSSSASIGGGIANNGKILVTASGHGSSVTAGAIFDATVAGANITNTGTISVNAHATGTTDFAPRVATAYRRRFGAYASARALGVFEGGDDEFGTGVINRFSNSGTISLAATAVATGFAAYVRASASGAVGQVSWNGADLVDTLTNTGSLISLSAAAQAEGTSSSARARATAGYALYQDAANSGSGPGNSITLTVTNQGAVSLQAIANAQAVYSAEAEAWVGEVIVQSAQNAGTIIETITNSAPLTIAAKATAAGFYSSARVGAQAQSNRIFDQEASGANSATLSIDNEAPVMVSLSALASGPDELSAEAMSRGIFSQRISDASNGSETILNNSAVTVDALATAASGDAYRASALASSESAFNQYATGDNLTQSLTNSGALLIDLKALATASQRAGAGARQRAIRQTAEGNGTIQQTLTNSGSLDISANAKAAGGTEANANANADGVYQEARYSASGSAPNTSSAHLLLTNTGVVDLDTTATAISPGSAEAYAEAEAFGQYGYGGFATVSEMLTNANAISLQNLAQASGSRAYADAFGYGLSQTAYRNSDATLSIVNSGSLSLRATAQAVGTISGSANVRNEGIYQSGGRSSAGALGTLTLSVDNSGTIELVSNAQATPGASGYVEAYSYGVEQEVYHEPGTINFDNGGTIDVAATATGNSPPAALSPAVRETTTALPQIRAQAFGLYVRAYGNDYTRLYQTNGGSGTIVMHSPAAAALNLSNSGTISVAASAGAPSLAAANIAATANGVAITANSRIAQSSIYFYRSGLTTQDYFSRQAGSTVGGAVSNSGTISVSASAPGGKSTANGILVSAGENDTAIVNAKDAVISVVASGAAAVAAGIRENSPFYTRSGTSHRNSASGYSHSTEISGVGPSAHVSGSITNNGTIDVSATGVGTYIGSGDSGGIRPKAKRGGGNGGSLFGIEADGIAVDAEAMSANILNSGTIDVAAVGAGALANGIRIFASQTGIKRTNSEFGYRTSFGSSSSSSYQVTQHRGTQALHTALGGNTVSGTITNTGTLNVSASGAGAVAKGIAIEADTFDGVVANSGIINVVANGTDAVAEGVSIAANTLGPDAMFENNGGTISATVNGARGTAIDVSGAPSSLLLALNGGSIYGNVVENAAGNAISIGSGNLVLDGIVNPSQAKLGTLTVGANGTLTLANNAAEGNAAAYVNSFVQNGTLAIVGSTDGSSGSIHAGQATLSGGAVVDVNLSAQYGTSTTYKVVFSDASLSGTWSNVSPSVGGTFFTASGVYSANEADITLSRASFDAVAGLTPNEAAVGSAIETIYDQGATGTLGQLTQALLGLTPAQYADALEALSGIPAAELSATDQATVQSFLDQILSHLGDSTTGSDTVASLLSGSSALPDGVAPTNVSPAQLSDLSGTHVWGGAFFSGSSVDSTISGPAYNSHQSGLLAGVDVPLTRNLLVGMAAAWMTGDINTENMETNGNFNAGLVSAYARYQADSGIYVLADASYGSFSNKLNRYVSIPGFGSGDVHGSFDTNAWSFYGEAGWHLMPEGWSASVTPYAALSYLKADSDGYAETGTFAAPLTVHSASSQATSSYLGVKLSMDWTVDTTTFTPRLTAAWQHDFTKDAWQMAASFTAAPTVGFGLTGAGLARDGLYLDGGFTIHAAQNVDILLDYQGRFTADRSDNAGLARINIKL
jgi:outer membrane autotransporter protein